MLIPLKSLIQKYNIKPTGILHVGANTGQEAKDYYDNGIPQVIWIEADPSLIPALKKNVSRYPNSAVVNACVGEVDGKVVEFNIANNGGQSSSVLELDHHKIAHPEVKYIDKVSLKTIRLDTLLIHNKIDLSNYDFINFDLQGFEGQALTGLGELVNKVNYSYLETNEKELYAGCWLLPQMDEFMQSKGFKRVEIERTNFGWSDSFFIRE